MAEEICKEYESSLRDLTFNSKPHISMLTMLAEENAQYAPQIVKVIEAHLQKVKSECKLPAMYLIDSIVKNVGQVYSSLFMQNLVSSFCSVFEKVDEKVRMQLFKLRQTWNDIFPNKKLYAIDIRVKQVDPAWPVTAQPPPQPSIHVNPKFLKPPVEESDVAPTKIQDAQEEEMRKQLLAKQQELLKLQRQKLELELLQTQVIVEEQKRQLFLKEQQMLRVQQHAQEEVQKVLQQQQLTTTLASATISSGDADSSPPQHVTVEQTSGMQTVSMLKEQNVPKSDSSVPRMGLDESPPSTQTVVSSPFMVNSNKTIDTNSFAKKGPIVVDSEGTSATKTKASTIDSASAKANFAKSSDTVDVKHAAPGVVSPTVSVVNQGSSGSKEPTKAKSSKSSPKDGSSKGDSVKKSKDSGKKHSPSSKKKDDRKEDSGSRSSSSSSKDKSSTRSSSSRKRDSKESTSSLKSSSSKSSKSKSQSRTKSNSLSPLRSKDKSEPRSSTSRGHSRSPGCSSDKDERASKRNRRSPHKDKENAETRSGDDSGQKAKLFSFSHKADVDLRPTLELPSKSEDQEPSLNKSLDGEPPVKKKRIDSELDDIFSGKDQDYRQLGRPVPARLSPIGEQSWAQYKASRPEEFKNPLRSRDNVDPFGFGNQDLDLRTPGMMRGGYHPWGTRDPRISGFRDPRIRRSDIRSHGSRLSSRLLPQQQIYQAIQESDPNIPRALMFDRGADIMRQAEQQLKSGQITLEQHAELMEQLAKLYELQRMRYLQREQQARDKVVLNRTLSSEEPSLKSASQSLPMAADDNNVVSMEIDEPSLICDENAGVDKEQIVELGSQEELALENADVVGLHLDTRKTTETSNRASDVEVIVINDDGPEKPKLLPKYDGKRRGGSRWSSPLHPHQTVVQGRSLPNTVMIDDKPREVRFFEGKAVVILDNEDIREIGFRGPPQEVFFDDRVIRLGFNNVVKEFDVDGHLHTVKFGAPTREIVIDDVPYAAVFGGPPIVVGMHGKAHELRLAGPTPEVYFGDQTRGDLLPWLRKTMAGKVQIGDARKEHLVERSPPRSGSPMRWATTTIGRDYETRDWKAGRDVWRGSPSYHDDPYRRYRPGERRQRDEMWLRDDEYRGVTSRGGITGRNSDRMPGGGGGRHGSPQLEEFYEREARHSPYRDTADQRQSGFYNRDTHFRGGGSYGSGPPGMRSVLQQRHRFEGPATMNHFLPSSGHGQSMRHPSMVQYPVPFGYRNVQLPTSATTSSYKSPMPNFGFTQNAQHTPGVVATSVSAPQSAQIDVGELFAKLVATGILSQVSAASTEKVESEGGEAVSKKMESSPNEKQQSVEKMPSIDLMIECLKVRHAAVISVLYCGIQCSSCGIRFTAEQTDKYAQHLDWHFRQNRREKNSARKALSRKWYYDIQDWVQFEEIEDLEERARSFFELQANEEQSENAEDNVPSVVAGESEDDKKCCVCQEMFELYWNEDLEEWHFRDVVRHEEKNYHPLCYEDIKEKPNADDNIDENVEEEKLPASESLVAETAEESKVEVEVDLDLNKVEVKMEVTGSDIVELPVDELPHTDVKMEENMECKDGMDGKDASENIVIKVEAMDIKEEPDVSGEPGDVNETDPIIEEDPEMGNDPEALSIFNVVLSGCSLPPLIGLEPEAESDKTEVKTEPSEAALEAELEERESNEEQEKQEVEPGEKDENEEEEKSDQTLTKTCPDEDDANTEGNILRENTTELISEDVTETAEYVASEEVQLSEVDQDMLGQDETETVDENVLSQSPEDEIGKCVQFVTQENLVKVECVAPKDEEDVTLKESSDIIVDFAFDQPSPQQTSAMVMKSKTEEALMSASGAPDEDLNEDSNDAVDVDPRFKILPPVMRGTELSGLCSIM